MNEHKTVVRREQDGDRYRAVCNECAWTGDRAYSRPDLAETSGREHEESPE